MSAAIATAAAMLVAIPAAAGSGLSPTIGSFSPMSANVGTTVTIDGSGFSTATAVAFNFNATPFTVMSDSEITAKVPLGEDRGPITVTGPGGTAVSASNFSLLGFYVTTTTLAPVGRGFPYSVQLQVAGGDPQYRWSKTGKLPRGLTLSRQGLLSGLVDVKATPGAYVFSVTARDSTRRVHQVANRTLSLSVS